MNAAFIKRNYHWFFAAIAALLVLVRFVPATCLSEMTADQVPVPLLFHDVVEEGHPAHDWIWGGHSDIFPDVSLVFLVDWFLRNGLLTLQAASGVILAAFLAVLILLYRQNGGRNAGTFAAMLLLFFVLLLINFGLHDDMRFTFVNTAGLAQHTSVAIIALGCFALCQRTMQEGSVKSLCWLAALCFATSLSDDIFQVLFTAPILAALVVTWLLYRAGLRLFVPLVATILITCAAGHLLAPRLSPFEIDPAPYTHFHSASAAKAWYQFLKLCAPAAGGDFIVFVALDLLLVLFATGVLVRSFFKPLEKRMPLPLFMLLMFCACLIDCNWGAAILAGNFYGILAARYMRLAILLPFFVSLGYINHLIPWSAASGRAGISALSLAVCACALFLAPSPDHYYRETQQLVPLMRATMQKEHIEAGLADYWYANPISFFSQDALPVRAVTMDGSLFHWTNTSIWYTGDGAANPPPKFRLIFMANLDPDKIRQRYGPPERIIPAPVNSELWIYPPEKSIAYNPVFGALSNGPANEYRLDGSLLPSTTGRQEGHSMVARARRDHPGVFIIGPYPYLRPVAGRYRITILHKYLSAPDPGKLVSYDVTYWTGPSPRTLDSGNIPFIDNAQHEFTREVEVPDDKHGVFRVTARYYGSGDLSVDSLGIVYLGK